MKTLLTFLICSLLAANLAANAEATSLQCASKKGESLYYTDGQLVLEVKTVISDTAMYNSSLTLLPADKLGAKKFRVAATGRSSDRYVRFELGGDAWCSYRVALPRGFNLEKSAFPAFVDAYCEENSNYSIRMNCRLH